MNQSTTSTAQHKYCSFLFPKHTTVFAVIFIWRKSANKLINVMYYNLHGINFISQVQKCFKACEWFDLKGNIIIHTNIWGNSLIPFYQPQAESYVDVRWTCHTVANCVFSYICLHSSQQQGCICHTVANCHTTVVNLAYKTTTTRFYLFFRRLLLFLATLAMQIGIFDWHWVFLKGLNYFS